MKYRKKPVVIEAFKFDGDMIDSSGCSYVPEWAISALKNGALFYQESNESPSELFIKTLEGTMHVEVGDWIVKGVKSELYPVKPSIFEATYEPVEE